MTKLCSSIRKQKTQIHNYKASDFAKLPSSLHRRLLKVCLYFGVLFSVFEIRFIVFLRFQSQFIPFSGLENVDKCVSTADLVSSDSPFYEVSTERQLHIYCLFET